MRPLEIDRVARHHGQPVAQAGGGDDQVGLREGVSDAAPFIDQQAPAEHHVLRHRQRPVLEHRADAVGQPVVQFGAAHRVGDALDAVADLGQRDRADVQVVQRQRGDERDHAGVRARAAQLGQHVGVDQPAAAHSSTSRTGISMQRGGSMSMSWWGDACSASTSSWPVRAPVRRR